MKNNINEQIFRIKKLMFNKNIILEQTTTGCTRGNCDNGEGTYISADNIKSVGTFKDGNLVKGTTTYNDGSIVERNYDDNGSGNVVYTNPSGWKSPIIPYQKANGTWNPIIAQGNNDVRKKIFEQLDTFKSEQQCICSETIDGQTPSVQLESNKTVAFIELSKKGSTESFYKFYSSNRVINFEAGTELKRGTFSCDGSKIKILYGDKTEETLGGDTQTPSNDSNKKQDSNKKTYFCDGKWKKCSSVPLDICCIDRQPEDQSPLKKVQKCIGTPVDGKYGPKTKKALENKGYATSITQEVYDKIMADCGQEKPKEEPKPEEKKDIKKQEDPFANWQLIEPED